MKKVMILVIGVILLSTGCSSSDLEDYREAVNETESYETGIATMDLSIDLIFNEAGLSFEEIRDLSYFEEIDVSTETFYDNGDAQKIKMENYYNFGGIGFDMDYYITEEEVLIRLPILDKYIKTEKEAYAYSHEEENVIKEITQTWNSILGSEDVLSGKKTYIMTDKGQIKTTTYTLTIDNDQFTLLKDAVLEMLGDEALINTFLEEGKKYSDTEISPEEIQATMKTLVTSLELAAFQGKAYVDFDNRLVRQVIECTLVNTDSEPGEVSQMTFNLESNYDQLGEAIEIIIPEVKEEDLLDPEDTESIQDFLPEGLFN